ncbi:hypothetical protein C8J57DRAFT_1515605 [Mycena rebaudengoi]|nr:hypothetical protein C8J57DRAFT_1515605 [Mycena rebaudengoi]
MRSALSPLLLCIDVLIQVLSVYPENSFPSDTTHPRLRLLPKGYAQARGQRSSVSILSFLVLLLRSSPTTPIINVASRTSQPPNAIRPPPVCVIHRCCARGTAPPPCAALLHAALPPIRTVLVAPTRVASAAAPDGVFHTSELHRCSRGFPSSTAQYRTRRAIPALKPAFNIARLRHFPMRRLRRARMHYTSAAPTRPERAFLQVRAHIPFASPRSFQLPIKIFNFSSLDAVV